MEMHYNEMNFDLPQIKRFDKCNRKTIIAFVAMDKRKHVHAADACECYFNFRFAHTCRPFIIYAHVNERRRISSVEHENNAVSKSKTSM